METFAINIGKTLFGLQALGTGWPVVSLGFLGDIAIKTLKYFYSHI